MSNSGAPGSKRNPFSATFWRSPRPPHAFVLTEDRISYVGPADPAHRAALSATPAFRALTRALPVGTFTAGPDGSPLAGPQLAAALQRLLTEAGGKIPAASLVVPDGWVKLLVIDAEEPERRAREVEEVLRWKFGRAFGEPVPPLRLTWQLAGPGAEGTRIVALAASEQAASSWEGPFEKAGIRVGSLETAAFAVSVLGARAAGEGFLVWADGDVATTLVFSAGQLRFARTRKFADAGEAVQDIRLAVGFGLPARSADGAPAEITAACAAGPFDSPVVAALRAFRAEAGAAEPEILTQARLVPGASVMPAEAAAQPSTLAALGTLAGGD